MATKRGSKRAPPPPPAPVRAAPAAKRVDPREEAVKQRRASVRRGRTALAALGAALGELGAREDAAIASALAALGERLDALTPPLPRACKEYRRAVLLAREGAMGMHPDDVVRFCGCVECQGLREDRGIPHPPAPRGVAD
jgi:hypothetical protein